MPTLSFQHTFRVAYADTDRMGYMYYGNYARYLEIARVEALRSMGIRYRDLEDEGILLPVFKLELTYLKAIKYDEEVLIDTTITYESGARVSFDYSLTVDGVVTTKALVVLVFVNAQTSRPCQPPSLWHTHFQAKTLQSAFPAA